MARCITAANSPSSQISPESEVTRPLYQTPLDQTPLGDRPDRLARDVDDLVDLGLLDHQRRRHGDGVARLAHHETKLERLGEGLVTARSDRALGGEVDA